AQQHPAIHAAVTSDPTPSPTIPLLVRDPRDHITTTAKCNCTQFAWSPDSNSVLFSTGTTYTILHIKDNAAFSVSGEDGSVPYWSPDSQFLLLDGLHTLQLVYIAGQQQQSLLRDTATI